LSFFEELKRRNVFRVGMAYVIAAWVLLQFADLVLENIQAPDWIMKVFMLALAIGFPLAVFFAWAFEMTPEGIKKEKDVDRSQSITPKTGRKLDRSIIVVLLIAVVYFAWDNFSPVPAGSKSTAETAQYKPKSIAVLPFADLSQAQDQEWFADGLAEEILNVLAKTPDLLVSSRTSSFRYKDSTLDLPDIAAELGVAHILEGSIRSSGNRIRVTAQLIRASDGFHLWSENYDRDVADMIEIQEDLALNIANALETTMDPDALAAMINAGTRSVEAYEAYLRGQAAKLKSNFSKGDGTFYKASYELFEQARSIDPGFAAAHFEAADFWKVQLSPSWSTSGLLDLEPRQMFLELNERIDSAIASAPTELDQKGYMAYKALVELRLRESIRLYHDYLKERPNDEQARYDLGTAALMASDSALLNELWKHWRERGATDEAVAFSGIQSAYRFLNPSEAADFGLQALQRWPNNNGLMYQTHRTLMWAGRITEARALADRYSRLNAEDVTLVLARQACGEGHRADAEAIYNSLDPNDNYYRSNRWHLLKLLGEEQQAIEALQPYAESGVPFMMASWLVYHKFDPAPFPELLATLDREGINRPPAVEIPFKCPPPEQTSIAVLPFVNMSTDADNEFFSDGISEEILNVLASIPDLKVAARTSAFAFKGSNTKISQIAKELGVNHVLEGSVRKSGNQVRVTAQLIKADDGFHLWSANYDRELTNIFAIQDEIAGSIADALRVSLNLESGSTGNLTGTRSIEAYEHYLKGMSLWHERTVISLTAALEEFELAASLDSQFAKAYVGQALYWGVIDGYINVNSEETNANASAAANRALSLEPDNAEAITALGLVARGETRFDEGVEHFKRAIKLNPSYATAYQWYGGMLGEMGDAEAGIAMYRKAWSLDPRSRIIAYNLAWRLNGSGYSEEAEQLGKEVLGFAPEFPDGMNLMFNLEMYKGNCAAARQYIDRLITVLKKTVNSTQLYMDLCQKDDPEIRAQAIEEMLAWDELDFSDPSNPSLSYSFDLIDLFVELDELDAARRLLLKYKDDLFLLANMRTRRTTNAIRFQCDPRVQTIVEQSNMAPPIRPIDCS
jgi:TolB-like protein/tetratricopeptide (TPR) repeat protein